MSVHLWDKKLTWLAVPKAGCTSVKHAFFQAENGHQFQDFVANGQYFHIHRIYPTRKFSDLPQARLEAHIRLAVVRDPVARVVSCYGDRVVYNGDLSEQAAGPALAEAGLKTDPGLEEFVERLEEYRRAVPSINHHVAPMTAFLGRDPDYFSGVFPLRKLADFSRQVTGILGRPFQIEHHQAHGPKFDADDLSARAVATIRRIFLEDFEIWSRFF